MPEGSVSAPRRRLLGPGASPPSSYVDVVNMAWETSQFPGIRHKILFTDPASGMSTLLFRLDPGAVVPLRACARTALSQPMTRASQVASAPSA